MSASLGNFVLWLSLLFAFLQFFTSRKNSKKKFIALSVNGLLFTSIISFFLLMYSHVISDFSVLNVYQNSHTTKPMIYKIAGVWGNHEGSMLLWILVLTIFNYFLFRLYNKENSIFWLKYKFRGSSLILAYILENACPSLPSVPNRPEPLKIPENYIQPGVVTGVTPSPGNIPFAGCMDSPVFPPPPNSQLQHNNSFPLQSTNNNNLKWQMAHHIYEFIDTPWFWKIFFRK